MNKLNWMWLVLAILYTGFFSWYTSFGGPLSRRKWIIITRYWKREILMARRNNGPGFENLWRKTPAMTSS